jgi:hypothetical protein
MSPALELAKAASDPEVVLEATYAGCEVRVHGCTGRRRWRLGRPAGCAS